MHLTQVYTTYCGLRKLPSTSNMTTFGTTITILPSDVGQGQVFQTGFFVFKLVFEFRDCGWVVFHTPILYIVPA